MGDRNPFKDHLSPQSDNFSFFRRGSNASSRSSRSSRSSTSESRSAQNSSSGFSLRRSLSGRSQNRESRESTSGDHRQSLFGNMFSGSRGQGQRPQSPPPSYSQSVGTQSVGTQNVGASSSTTATTSANTLDDQYAFLREFNTIFLIDDSLSMKAENRWGETQKAISTILPICMEHDDDGIDVYFLNHRTSDPGDGSCGVAGTGYRNVKDVRVVQDMFKFVKPSLATPTGMRLDYILRPYLRNYEAQVYRTGGDVYSVPPINIIVITDGQPTDEPGEIIAQAARRLDEMRAPPHQIGIQFFQVGRDANATSALEDLDNELCRQEGIRDMVDTATFNGANKANQPTLTADGILKVVLGAVKRKLDRKVMIRVDGPRR
ncbi:Phosphatidylinositol-3-phosphatase SAC1 [Hypoxylon texense]